MELHPTPHQKIRGGNCRTKVGHNFKAIPKWESSTTCRSHSHELQLDWTSLSYSSVWHARLGVGTSPSTLLGAAPVDTQICVADPDHFDQRQPHCPCELSKSKDLVKEQSGSNCLHMDLAHQMVSMAQTTYLQTCHTRKAKAIHQKAQQVDKRRFAIITAKMEQSVKGM